MLQSVVAGTRFTRLLQLLNCYAYFSLFRYVCLKSTDPQAILLGEVIGIPLPGVPGSIGGKLLQISTNNVL